ncbi:alpha-L-fucosidase [Flagellimonas onchidii]|uniref:alpha-L-fucosidase n=1 Tax=Flagellimonas onchidii TaxID=2562684 RepID=UPI0010A5BEC7|nr:alpha-L-fucosidase [Allomuricauda onchidii]
MNIKIFLAASLLLLMVVSCKEKQTQEASKETLAKVSTWEDLQNMPIPTWYEDAKFGIFIHWGPYAVPGWSDGREYSEWYATMMYRKPAFIEYHTKNYGKPGEFGYKDFIPMFKAEKFNANAWADVFEASGAKFIIPTAEHHDGFAMWNTDLTPWNSVDMGPKFDFIDKLGKAVRDKGLKYGISYHRERHWGYYTSSLNTYKENPEPVEGVAKEVAENPLAEQLYGPFGLTEAFMKDYKARFVELCTKYQPDFMWIDDAPSNSLFPKAPAVDKFMNTYHREMIADYVNMSREWGKDVYWNNKRWTRSNYPQGAGVDEKDYLRMDSIPDVKWQSSGGMAHSYGYDRTEDIAEKYKPVGVLVRTLIDVVSKNGNFLLDIGPKPDGTLTDLQISRLKGIGDWLKRNGEAIYGTRTWNTFGYDNIRFTQKENTLYIISLERPESELVVKHTKDLNDIKSVTLLDGNEAVEWQQTSKGIKLSVPELEEDHAYVFKMEMN